MGRLLRVLALLIICVTICAAAPALGAVIYVKWDSANNGPGNDWVHAYHTVTAALTASTSGGEVWVAGASAHPYVERITLKAGVGLYGGFAGTETARVQRSPRTNITVLDGNQGGSVVTCLSGATSTTVIDGFTIRGGTGKYYSTTGSYCGGGVYCDAASPTISDNTITRNSVSGQGGGIWCSATASPMVNGNTITANVANNGGGIYTYSGAAIYNNFINGNACLNSAGAAGVYAADMNNVIGNNTITANEGGYGLYGYLSTVYNNIVAFNSNGIYCVATLQNNCVYNPDGTNYANQAPGTGDIQVDPKLVAAQYGQVHILPTSPCRNAGRSAALQTDIDGQPRNDGGGVDIGADESYDETPAFTPVTIRVSTSGNDGNDGSSWALAKRTVQAGIEAANAQGGDVWVASGIYNEKITLWPYVSLYGGFAGTETSLANRDWRANAAVIDAGGTGSVVTVWTAPRATATRIDGFTIRNGGGTYNSDVGSTGGGGIYCYACSPIISNNIITQNRVTGRGGGIWCYGTTSTAVICGNTITGNVASDGGGIHSTSAATISNNVINANVVQSPLGAAAGIYADPNNVVANNTITANDGGYAVYALHGSVYNNIIAFNSTGILVGAATLKNNCVYNPDGTNYTNQSPGTGDIQVDPKLVAVQYGQVHILPTSPCRNAGCSTAFSIDIDGQPRDDGGGVDIGADESYGETPAFSPVTIRVSTSGNDSNDGSSWALAKRTVQAGINAAKAQGGDVWVASGIYNEKITLWPYVSLYGGFAGTETSLVGRDWVANTAVIDGGATGSVVTVCTAARATASRVDGFTIRNGRASSGGGIFCSGSSPTICNNTISSNVTTIGDGGGVYSYDSRFGVISNNTITSNTAAGYGGGICAASCYGGSISGNRISSNKAAKGGGITTQDSPSSSYLTLSGNTISSNTAGTGGGFYLYQSRDVVSSNLITGNTATSLAGGIYWYSGGATIVNNTVVGNTAPAGKGGAICGDDYWGPKISNNVFAFNSSGIYRPSSAWGTPVLKNNCVYNPAGANYTGLSAGATDFSLDPLFVNSAGGDYHPKVDSPCIDAGDNASVTAGSLDLDGRARIVPAAGNVDIGAFECIYPLSTAAQAKSGVPDGQLVCLVKSGKVTTTAVLADQGVFYVESLDRLFGIQCRASVMPSLGQSGYISGTMATMDGERLLSAAAIVPESLGTSPLPAPLMLTNKDIGGGPLGLQGGVWGWMLDSGGSTRSWQPIIGLNNIGLLVTTCGTVTEIQSVTPPALPTWFKIDDGSGVGLKCIVPSAVTTNPVGTHVMVTGISSCETVGAELHRLLRVRSQTDIVAY